MFRIKFFAKRKKSFEQFLGWFHMWKYNCRYFLLQNPIEKTCKFQFKGRVPENSTKHNTSATNLTLIFSILIFVHKLIELFLHFENRSQCYPQIQQFSSCFVGWSTLGMNYFQTTFIRITSLWHVCWRMSKTKRVFKR